MKLLASLMVAAAVLFAAGCAQLTRSGTGKLSEYRQVFVEQRLNDNLGIDRALVAELRALGYEAESGPLTMMPPTAELIVTFDARETWDFRPYLIELTATVRPAKDYHRILASTRYFRPGVTKKSSDEMAREVIKNLFPPARVK